jgi:uncharacterized Zn-finger protein
MAHTTDATDTTLNTSSVKNAYQVHRSDLPLSCPTHEQKLWDSHPRVYLAIEETGSVICPYCSAVYTLVD